MAFSISQCSVFCAIVTDVNYDSISFVVIEIEEDELTLQEKHSVKAFTHLPDVQKTYYMLC